MQSEIDPALWLKDRLIDEGYGVYISGARGDVFLQVSLHHDNKPSEFTTLQLPSTLEQAAKRYWMASTYVRHGRIAMRPMRHA